MVKGNLTNAGTINSTPTGSVLNMNGAGSTQIISGSGNWTATATGTVKNLAIGSGWITGPYPAVDLQTDIAVQNYLNLNKGTLAKFTELTRQARIYLATLGVTAVPVLVLKKTEGKITIAIGSPEILSVISSLQ